MRLKCTMQLFGVAIAVAALLCSFAGRAWGQGNATLSSPVVSLDGAAQLDTGIASVLSSGTLRLSGSNYAQNAAQLEYRGQPATTYQPMVQGADVTSFSLSTGQASRAPSAGDRLGFGLKRTTMPSDRSMFPGGQRFDQRMAAAQSVYARLDGGNVAGDPNVASSAQLSGLQPTSCLDLPAGCSGFGIVTAPVIVAPVRRTATVGKKGLGGAGPFRRSSDSYSGLSSWTGTGGERSGIGSETRSVTKDKAAAHKF